MTDDQVRQKMLSEGYSANDIRVALEAAKGSIQQTLRDTPEESVTTTWRRAVAPATDALGEAIGRFFQTMSESGTMRGPKGFLEPAGPVSKMAGTGIASTVIPQTPTQAALAGLPFAPGFARLPFTGRVALPVVTGAGVSRATGESALSGAAQGALAASGVEGVRGAITTGRLFRSRLGSSAKERAVAEEAAPLFGEALAKDVKEIRGLPHQTSRELLLLRDPTTGVMNAIKAAFDRVDASIVATFGTQPMAVPTMARSQAAAAVAKKLGVSPMNPMVQKTVANLPATTLPAEEAGTMLKLLKDEARQAPPGPEGFGLRLLARTAEREYVSAIAAKSPALAQQYQDAVLGFDRGLKATRLLSEVPFARDVKGATLRPEALRKFLTENMEQYPPSTFPSLWKSAFPLGAEGAGDIVTRLGGERLYVPLPGTPRVSVPLGNQYLVNRPGAAPIQPPVVLPGLAGAAGAALGAGTLP